MIQFERYKLDNGLTVIHHYEPTSSMAVVNVMYDVGARDEQEDKTGFAHLFEHLMFGGSVNVPDFDTPLQRAGGTNNAYTSNDVTNYYDIIPAQNIETALWLESDRMLSLAFSPKSLEVQRQVVIEEFKQNYLNQPYGDAWLELRPLAYKKHPYKWATIGKNIQHIEDATMEDVKAFFKKFYHPANAILCICGNVTLDETKRLVDKWFAEIPASLKPQRILPKEPEQKEYRVKTIERDVPNDVFMFAFKMPERKSFEYYVTDIMGSILGRSKSSMLYSKLKKEMNLVSDVATFDTGSFNEGLLIVEGELRNGVSFDELEVAFWRVIDDFIKNAITENEVLKMRNKNRTYIEFENLSLRQRAEKLCLFELLGDAEGVNEENELYKQITPKQVQQLAKKMLIKENCSLLKIKAKQA